VSRILRALMPEASNSDIHGHIHGQSSEARFNTGGVEENPHQIPPRRGFIKFYSPFSFFLFTFALL
jgi:hypothetical protein